MSILPLTCTPHDTDCDAEEAQTQPQNSRCSSGCYRRYPRLFSNLLWIYLLAEGLCFVIDVAFLSTTVMAARSGALNMTGVDVSSTAGSYLFDEPEEEEIDDDVAFWNRTQETDNYASMDMMFDTNEEEESSPDTIATNTNDTTTTTTTEELLTLDWPTLKNLVLQQWKLQWEHQQAVVRDWLAGSSEATAS